MQLRLASTEAFKPQEWCHWNPFVINQLKEKVKIHAEQVFVFWSFLFISCMLCLPEITMLPRQCTRQKCLIYLNNGTLLSALPYASAKIGSFHLIMLWTVVCICLFSFSPKSKCLRKNSVRLWKDLLNSSKLGFASKFFDSIPQKVA